MKPDPTHILNEALQLEPAIRAFIAEALLESLDFEEDFPLSPEWMIEIRQRCAAIDNRTARLIDHDIALNQLRETSGQ